MLTKPYYKIKTIENNNYYLLQVNNILYLAVESVLRFNEKGKEKELQQGLKLLPIYSPILLLLTRFARLESTEEKTVEGLGSEKIYPILDVDKVRTDIKIKTEEIHEESMFDFGVSIKSSIVRKLIEENDFQLLMKLRYDTFRTSYWLAKTDQFGKLTIHDVSAGGRTKEKFAAMDTFFLDLDLVGTILIEYNNLMLRNAAEQKKRLKKALKKQQKQIKNKKMEENKE